MAIMSYACFSQTAGLSRHGECDFSIELKCEIFQLPVIENQVAVYVCLHSYHIHERMSLFSSEIPHQLTEDIQKYFYRCIGGLAGLQSAFVTPTKVR